MIQLLSIDLDGTLVDETAPVPGVPELFELLAGLRRRGVRWAVNTGRGLGPTLEGLRGAGFPLEPDYLLTNEREVFHRAEDGAWRDFGDWNQRCAQAYATLLEAEGALLSRLFSFLERHTRARVITEDGHLTAVVSSGPEELEQVVRFLEEARSADSLLRYQRSPSSLRFHHAHHSKGTALAELCRLTGIPAAATCSIGDHLNDLPMLDRRHAHWLAAPSNAVSEVQAAVRAAGGYVASSRCGQGVLEALRHFQLDRGLA